MGGLDSLLSSLLFAGGAGLDGLTVGGGLPQPLVDAKRKALARPITSLDHLKPWGISILQRDRACRAGCPALS